MKRLSEKKRWLTTAKRFVVFLDIMGFKDFVARNPHKEVYESMLNISKSLDIVMKQLDDIEKDDLYSGKDLYATSFSDSIILFTKDDTIQSFELILVSAAFILEDAIENKIAMKGAMAFGDISVNKQQQIYFGQPLIDAYLLQEELNYYGIIAHNSVDKYISVTNLSDEIKTEYFEIKTPLKSGKISHTNINWFTFLKANEKDYNILRVHLNEKINQLKYSTSGSPRKYLDNTIDVFNEVLKIKNDLQQPPSLSQA